MRFVKIALILGGTGISSLAFSTFLYFNSGESIVEYIIRRDTTKKKKFISLVSDAHGSLKKKYSLSTQHKPIKDNKVVEEYQIIKWCQDSLNAKFSSEEEPTYLSIDTWCFVNTSTLLEEAQRGGKKQIKGNNGNSQEWQEAWEKYNEGKVNEEFLIKDDSVNGLDKEKGGPALFNWCKAQENHKMYEEGFEGIYKKYDKWCFSS